MLVEDVLDFYYIFQSYSIILFFCDHYEVYALVILVTSLFSIILELQDLRDSQKHMKEMVDYHCKLTVKRRNNDIVEYKQIDSDDLVPGDIFIVPQNIKLPCDAILLTGSCVVNESLLTGESIPVTKLRLPDDSSKLYDPIKYKNHTLFSGTEVILSRKLEFEEVRAMVIRTNLDTLKGSLVKSILFPKQSRFNFYTDSLKFFGVIGCLILLMFFYTLPYMKDHISFERLIYRSIDLILIAIPPSLPTALNVSLLYAVARLKDNSLFCINQQAINVAGKIKTIIFDKTGTLTDDKLEFSEGAIMCEGKFIQMNLRTNDSSEASTEITKAKSM